MKAKYLLVAALGLWIVVVGFWVTSPAVAALRSSEAFELALLLLILGVLLTLGGGCLTWESLRHFKRAGSSAGR
jgi:hypothetical protein